MRVRKRRKRKEKRKEGKEKGRGKKKEKRRVSAGLEPGAKGWRACKPTTEPTEHEQPG